MALQRYVVPEPVVDVVVRYAGTRAERYLTAKVGKQVQPVVVVMLGDGQLAVQYKPVNQVRPALSPLSVLTPETAVRLGINRAACLSRWEIFFFSWIINLHEIR